MAGPTAHIDDQFCASHRIREVVEQFLIERLVLQLVEQASGIWFKDLIAELQQTSAEFREWWSEHDIRATCTEPRELKHPSLGRMIFHTNIFQVVDTPDLQMLVFTAAEAETARKLVEPVE